MVDTLHAGYVARARFLAWFSILYNIVEALVCGWFGSAENSLSLLGFGADSLMEAAAAGVVLWRYRSEAAGESSTSEAERRAERLVGGLLIALALLLAVGAVFEWLGGRAPQSGLPGAVIAVVSLIIMFWLYVSKRQVADALNSPVLKADAFCTLSCMWLSGLLLAGSLVFSATRLAVFDVVTSLAMAWVILKEGLEVWQESGCDCRS